MLEQEHTPLPPPPLARVFVGKIKTNVAVGVWVGRSKTNVAGGTKVSITASVAASVSVGKFVEVTFTVGELASRVWATAALDVWIMIVPISTIGFVNELS